jgi:hypothetical protein
MGGNAVTWWVQSNPRTKPSLGESLARMANGRMPVTTPSQFCGTPPMQRWPSGSQGADPRSVPCRQPHQQSGSVGSLTTAVVGLGGAAQLVSRESRTQGMRPVAATEELVVPQWLIVFPSKRGDVKPSRDHPLTFRRFSRAPSRCKFWARPPAREVPWGNGNHCLERLGNDDQFSRQIAKLSTMAKLTQARYGTSSQPARAYYSGTSWMTV